MKYIDDMLEGYLDSEEKYWDYGTGVISGNNVIDRYHTGISFYDQFFDPSEFKYLRDNKNLQGKVVMMTPEEYYEECAKYCWPGKNITPDSLKRQRSWDTDVIEKLKNVIFKYKRKLCMPMINYADPGQEGLHRMYVIGEIYGWDFKVPVLQVRHADEDRARKAAQEKRKSEIDWKVEKAITACYRYEFRDKEELEDQIKYELDHQFEFMDDVKIPDEIHLEETPEAFLLSVSDYEYPIDKEEIRWKEPDDSLDDDIEDLIDISDLEDTEDFLRRYFGDDWRETYPHLKDKFHITESVEKQLPKYLYHATYRNRWNAIKKSGGLKTHVRKRYWDDSRDVICMSEDPWVAESYAEEADDASDYELDNIVILKIDTSALDLDYLDIDGNILRDDDEELKNTEYEYSKDIPITAISLFNKKLDLVEPSIIQSNELEEDFSNNNEFFHSLLDELSEFDYAFIDADGEELDDEDAMKAVVQSPDQLEDLRKGVCTDFVEYTRAKLDERDIPYEVYYVACTDKDDDRPSHVFVVVENESKFLWLEAAWHSEAGIHEYNSLEELFEDIARKHCVYDGHNYLESCEIRKVKKSLVGMSQHAIYDYVNTLPITWKAAEEGITEELRYDPPYNEQQVKSNYDEETYQRLIKDPAHLWRMRTGIELIHKEPSKKELERIWANWQLMSDKQKLISDKKSIQLFGKTNAENYNELIKLYETVEKGPKLYCISQKDLNGQTLEPRVPDNFFTKNGYEDGKTPRVCFAPTIDQCLMAISQKCEGIEFYVFTPDNVSKENIYKPTVKEVPDSKITGEIWITCPVKLKKVGKIKVLGDSGLDGHPFNYGNKTAELYDWDWEWIKLYDKELSRLNESKADIQKLIDFAGEDLSNRFLTVRTRLKTPENDLYYWIKSKTPEELQDKITEVETTTTKSRQRKHAAQGAELVAENDYWKVYLITTPEAAKIYGKDTRWCISMRDNIMFWEKYRYCDIYVFITKEFYDPNGKCSKLALVHDPEEDEYDIFNQRDERLDRLPNCPIIPGVLEDSWLSGAKYYIELDEGQYISTEAPFDNFESELFTEPDAWLTRDYNKKLTFESYDEAYEFWYDFVLENILSEDLGYTISDSIGLTSEQD